MYLTFNPSLSKKLRSAATRNGSAVQLEPPVQPRFKTLGSAADANATDSATSTQAVKNSSGFRFIADLSPPSRSFLRRYLAKIFSEKIQGARPGCGIGVRAVTVPTLAIEGVAGSRKEIKLMGLS